MGGIGDQKRLSDGTNAQQVYVAGTAAEDAAHATGDYGLTVLAVRKDTAAALAGTDGDYIPLITDSSGRLHVNVGTGSVTATEAGGAVIGPGNPTVDSYTNATISLAANTANQEIIAAVASHQIWVYGFGLMGETGAGTVAFQDSDDTPITTAMAFADEGGICSPPSGNFAMPIWKVATGKALEADTTGTGTYMGWICYGVVNP